MSPTPIESVVFDFGKVLVDWDPFLPFDGLYTRDQVEDFFEQTDFFTFNHEQDAGRPLAEARVWFGERYPDYLPLLDTYFTNFARSVIGPVAGTGEIVDELTAGGTRVFGLTNWSTENVGAAFDKVPTVSKLQDVVVSGAVHLAKPDPRIFAHAIKQFALTPESTLFVDDLPANIDAAAAAGLQTHLFRTTDALRTDLTARGLLAETGPVRS